MLATFLGTFNKSLFDRFITFAKSQLTLVEARINHLQAEQVRIGSVVFKYEKGVPVGYASDPPTAYLGKLLAAYEVLGGNPAYDLRTRSMTDPVFLLRGSETTPPQFLSNGEPLPGKGLADAVTAELMHDARKWLEETLDYRFGQLERKIRLALDYSDQLQSEIDNLNVIKAAGTVSGSLEEIEAQIRQLFGDRNYRAVYDDNGTDPFGLKSYAPFSSFDDEGSASGMPQRQNSGYKGP